MSDQSRTSNLLTKAGSTLTYFIFAATAALTIACQPLDAADPKPVTAAAQGLQLRSIGPALMGGRIADIEVHPQHGNTWYVAVGSGGVWKTENAGVTWTPIFDDQGSYSIGCVTIDPHNHNIIWIGTGENNSQRSVGYGDGLYKSMDGGKSAMATCGPILPCHG